MSSSMHVHLFVEILNQYLYYFEVGWKLGTASADTAVLKGGYTRTQFQKKIRKQSLDLYFFVSRCWLSALLRDLRVWACATQAGNAAITEKYVSGLIALINEHMENMEASEQRTEVHAHLRGKAEQPWGLLGLFI